MKVPSIPIPNALRKVDLVPARPSTMQEPPVITLARSPEVNQSTCSSDFHPEKNSQKSDPPESSIVDHVPEATREPVWKETVRTDLMRRAMQEASQEIMFGPVRTDRDRTERERQSAELLIIGAMRCTHVLHFQTNLTRYVGRGSGGTVQLGHRTKSNGQGYSRIQAPKSVVSQDVYRKGRILLARFDAYMNQKLLEDGWRESPFRIQFYAYAEISSDRLHYHLAIAVHPKIAVRFRMWAPAFVLMFNHDRRLGCTAVLQELNDWTPQVRYVLKHIDNDIWYDNRVIWKDNLPSGWPHFVRRSGKYVRRHERPSPRPCEKYRRKS